MAIYFGDGQQNKAAHVIKCATISNTTRYVPTGTDNTLRLFMNFGQYNKIEANSDLYFTGIVSCLNNGGSGAMTLSMYFGSSINSSNQVVSGGTGAAYPGSAYDYDSDSWMHYVMTVGVIKGSDYSTTGNGNFLLCHRSANGNNNNRPAGICNPQASDDGRIENTMMGSRINVMEVLQL